MLAEEQIAHKLQKLPPRLQRQVLDFIDFLSQRVEDPQADETSWTKFSISQAMRGLENDSSPEYSETDLKEIWR